MLNPRIRITLWFALQLCSLTDSEYIFVNTLTNSFDTAEADCVATYSGHLAAIHSAIDNAAVDAACLDVGQFQLACMIGIDNRVAHVWADGTALDYTNWGDGGDGGAAQPLATMRQGGVWHTIGATPLPYVCEGTRPPTAITSEPSTSPTLMPSASPSNNPSYSPSSDPSTSPSNNPVTSQTNDPSVSPSNDPSVSPSNDPTVSPSMDPTVSPSMDPSVSPSNDPSASPSNVPSVAPTECRYIFVNTPTDSFDTAEADCVATYSGHLAAIHSAADNAAVAAACLDVGQFQLACMIGIDNRKAHVWADGTALDYTMWGDGGDGGAAQPLATIRQGGDWHTIGATPLPYVCEGICPTSDPSKSPSAAPTRKTCTKDVNYVIDGQMCVVEGDPHFTTWSGARHDFQGQPLVKSQYYYITPCAGESEENMPFKMIGKHEKWQSRTVTGLDYLTFELLDSDGTEYILFLSSSIASYAVQSGGVSTLYDAPGAILTSVAADTDTAIGSRFSLRFAQASDKRIDATLTIDGTCTVQFWMEGQTYFDGRWRMHRLFVSPPECYRCFICGLCGDFKREKASGAIQRLETCSGGFVEYTAGTQASNTFAYDVNANTWELSYCSRRRRLVSGAEMSKYTPTVGDDFTYIATCDGSIEYEVAQSCQTARDDAVTCCDYIGGTFCELLQKSCEVDACAASITGATSTPKIDADVEEIFTNAVDFACDIPGVAEMFDEARTIADTVLQDYVFPNITSPPTAAPTDITDGPTTNPVYVTTTGTTAVVEETDSVASGEGGAATLSVFFCFVVSAMLALFK